MNKSGTLFTMLLVAVTLLGQSCRERKNEDIFAGLEGEPGVYMLKIPPVLLTGMLKSDSTATATADTIGNIELVKVLLFNSSESKKYSVSEMNGNLLKRFNEIGYEAVFQASSGGTNISAYLYEKKGEVTDLMLLVAEGESIFGLGISGNLNPESIVNFAGEIEYDRIGDLVNLDGFIK
ncbi:MAG: DUF4252 domain-containing protein [Bacteroidales bacterium]